MKARQRRKRRPPIDSIGQRYGKLTVINLLGRFPDGGVQALCRCDCGRKYQARLANLRSNRTRSCGCLRRERRVAA